MRNFRQKETTHNPTVEKYVFTEVEPEYEIWIQRYLDLFTKAQRVVAIKATMSPAEKRSFKSDVLTGEEKEEMRELKQKIVDYKKRQSQQKQSVLWDSELRPLFDSGKDNAVYLSKKGRFVMKYSGKEYSATPETVEYLRKKYEILRGNMGDFIPQSAFVYGEKRTEMVKGKIDENILNSGDTREVAITMQRRVQGKNFREMTQDEKSRPEVLESLEEGFRLYWRLKRKLATTTKALGKPAGTLDVSLELGKLSREPDSDEFDKKKAIRFDSPNIMWDEEKQQVYFIDFDMKDWNQDKETIYQALMEDKSTTIAA